MAGFVHDSVPGAAGEQDPLEYTAEQLDAELDELDRIYEDAILEGVVSQSEIDAAWERFLDTPIGARASRLAQARIDEDES